MTYSKPLSISCTEIAADWYFLFRDIQILHEDVRPKRIAKGIVSVATLGIQYGQVTASTLERIRRHGLAVEKQMYSIQRKIKSLAADLDALTEELAAAQVRLYDEPHTIPATLAGEELDMTLSMFATQIFVMNGKNPSVQIARSYENLCMRAYGLFWKDTSPKKPDARKTLADRVAEKSPSYAKTREQVANAAKRQEQPKTSGAGKSTAAHLTACALGLTLMPMTGGLSLVAPLITQLHLERQRRNHSK